MLDWCTFNKLSLNASKSKAIIFSYRVPIAPNIMINEAPIEIVQSFKYLGIAFDCKLNFNMYLSELRSKLSRYCGLAFRLKSKLKLQTAISFYYAYFSSTLSYCIVAWGGNLICTQKGDRINSLQKRTIMNLFSQYDRDLSYHGLLIKHKILKAPDLYRFKLLCLMYEMLNLNFYPSLLNAVNPNLPEHEHFTRGADELVLPFPFTEQIRQSFLFQIINNWNRLSADIKKLPDFSSFKKKCTEYLIAEYSNSI